MLDNIEKVKDLEINILTEEEKKEQKLLNFTLNPKKNRF